MASQSAIKLTKLVERFELEVLNQGKNYDRCLIRADDINRPALQILGFFDYFAPDRIQVIGKVEWTYLNNQSPEERRKCFDAFLEKPIPALILTRSLEPFPELMEMAVKHKRTILRSKEDTSLFIPNFTDWLKARLSPRITRHGVLVDVYGEGVLLMGESGVGKSETAVELVKRGHRLVADDAVEIRHIGTRLVGSSATTLSCGASAWWTSSNSSACPRSGRTRTSTWWSTWSSGMTRCSMTAWGPMRSLPPFWT